MRIYTFIIISIIIQIRIPAAAQGLSISRDGYVTANAGNIILQGGNWVNNGLFIHNGGTVTFAGSAQTLGGTSLTEFNNLTINSGSTTTITTPGQTLKGDLLCNGLLYANGNLTLLAGPSQTALIDGSGAGEVLGNVTMQGRFISAFGYHYISSPFKDALVSQLSHAVNLAAPFPSLYRYDENQPSAGWINYTDSTALLVPLQGYTANFGTSSLPETLGITGVVNNGPVSSPTLYNHNNTYTLGFNLVGNPYPSPVDWNISGGWTRTNIDNAIYYFDASPTDQYSGTYNSYINGVSSNGLANNTIPAMQGFFIHVSDGNYPVSAYLSINNLARINTLTPSGRALNGIENQSLLRLAVQFENGATSADPVVVYFDDNATPGYDSELDALKLMNTDVNTPSLYVFSSDTARLSISAIPDPGDFTVSIRLGLETQKEGWIVFNASDTKNIPSGLHIYLSDKQTGSSQDLLATPQYRLYLEPGKQENRFFLTFKKSGITTIPESGFNDDFTVYTSGKNLIINVTDGHAGLIITNMSGQVISRQELTGNGYHPVELHVSSGIYVVTRITDKGKQSKKIFIQNY